MLEIREFNSDVIQLFYSRQLKVPPDKCITDKLVSINHRNALKLLNIGE